MSSLFNPNRLASCFNICSIAFAIVIAPSLSPCRTVAAESRDSTDGELSKTGILEFSIKHGDTPIVTKSIKRATSKLEAIQKAEARRPETRIPLLVSININGTTREFAAVEPALETLEKLSPILEAAQKAKIQLGELGKLGIDQSQSQQTSQQDTHQPTQAQPYRRTNARDGNDGFGVGGGLGGQGGGGFGVPGKLQSGALASLRQAPGGRAGQIELLRRLVQQALAVQQQNDSVASSPEKKVAKEYKLSKATLFSRMVHRDYQKATFSFEFGVRDDPKFLHANDWDLQYGNGGDHFHVTMVSDDRSRIVDLGQINWDGFAKKGLPKLVPNPQPRREFVQTIPGHIYVVHTVDRNSDHYAVFRVDAVDQAKGTCEIEWRLANAPK